MADSLSGCRSCGAVGLAPILSLGRTPLANRLLTSDQLSEAEPTYPLDLVFCPSCSLVQITETVPPEELFRDYAYFSSFSEGTLRQARELTARMARARKLDSTSLTMEIASNDGYLLQYYKQAEIPVIGIEPAANAAQVARRERGVPTLCEYFGRALAERLAARGQMADVVHANNVLAHVPDLNGFVAGMRMVIKDDGVIVIEAPYVRDLVENVEFDTIYHERLCYFSLSAMKVLLERHDLALVDAERIASHGGSVRAYAAGQGEASSRAQTMLDEEQEAGVTRVSYFDGFANRVTRLRRELTAMLGELKSAGKRIAAYGASAKASTLLNYCGIGRETLDFTVDRSTVKQGRYTPGTRLKIHAPEALLSERPDYVLLLSWSFAEEILRQEAEFRRQGGRFIIPTPMIKVA